MTWYLYLIPNNRSVRQNTTRQWKQDGKTTMAKESFTRSAAIIWNQAPGSIKDAKTLNAAKKAIQQYCQTLPI